MLCSMPVCLSCCLRKAAHRTTDCWRMIAGCLRVIPHAWSKSVSLWPHPVVKRWQTAPTYAKKEPRPGPETKPLPQQQGGKTRRPRPLTPRGPQRETSPHHPANARQTSNEARWVIRCWKIRTSYNNRQQELLIPKFNSLTAKGGDKTICFFTYSVSQLRPGTQKRLP